MRQQLIEVINRLHAVFSSTPILGAELEIPQIVVIGSQSSGKSSILEHIVGFEFLPRGTDIVTRCPIVLQLFNIPQSKNASEFVGEFSHLPDVIFKGDFVAIKNEIIARTKVLAGENKGISKVPIYLKIFSHKVPSLTLVDLPGITKIPIGSQPKDIESMIREIIYAYAKKPSSLLLAIIPANIDIVNSEALKFVSEIDPTGQRTLGVLSKIDLMDQGTNALEILLNRGSVRLCLGFVGVVCRSQKAIVEGLSIQESLEREALFFSSHPIYKSNSGIRCGTESLSLTLSNILMKHIRTTIPTLKSQITTLSLVAQTELKAIGSFSMLQGSCHDLSSSFTGKGCLVLKLLTKFSSDFEDAIQGTSRHISTSELYWFIIFITSRVGGARLQMIFHDTFASAVAAYDPTASLSLSDIRTAIRNANGARPSLFVPEMSFELLAKQQIGNLEAPSLFCVSMVYEELLKLITSCTLSELSRYPNLQKKVIEASNNLIKERLEPTRNMVQSLIAIELAYINTNHPDFCRAGAALVALEHTIDNNSHHSIRADEHLMDLINSETNSANSESPMIRVQTPPPPTTQLPPHNHPTQPTQLSPSNGSGILNFFFRSSSNSHHQANAQLRGGMASMGTLSPPGITTSSLTSINSSPSLQPALLAMAPEPTQSALSVSSNNRSKSISGIESKSMTEKEEIETHLILTLIRSYFNVVRKNIVDSVPKAIMHFLVNSVKENLHNRLVTELYRSDSEKIFDELLQEDPAIVKERERISTLVMSFSQALDILSEIGDMASE